MASSYGKLKKKRDDGESMVVEDHHHTRFTHTSPREISTVRAPNRDDSEATKRTKWAHTQNITNQLPPGLTRAALKAAERVKEFSWLIEKLRQEPPTMNPKSTRQKVVKEMCNRRMQCDLPALKRCKRAPDQTQSAGIEFNVAKFSRRHKFVCTSPRYAGDQETVCRPRSRTVGQQKNLNSYDRSDDVANKGIGDDDLPTDTMEKLPPYCFVADGVAAATQYKSVAPPVVIGLCPLGKCENYSYYSCGCRCNYGVPCRDLCEHWNASGNCNEKPLCDLYHICLDNKFYAISPPPAVPEIRTVIVPPCCDSCCHKRCYSDLMTDKFYQQNLDSYRPCKYMPIKKSAPGQSTSTQSNLQDQEPEDYSEEVQRTMKRMRISAYKPHRSWQAHGEEMRKLEIVEEEDDNIIEKDKEVVENMKENRESPFAPHKSSTTASGYLEGRYDVIRKHPAESLVRQHASSVKRGERSGEVHIAEIHNATNNKNIDLRREPKFTLEQRLLEAESNIMPFVCESHRRQILRLRSLSLQGREIRAPTKASRKSSSDTRIANSEDGFHFHSNCDIDAIGRDDFKKNEKLPLRQPTQGLNTYPDPTQSLETDWRYSLKQREHENLVESAMENLETRDGNATTNARSEEFSGNDSNKCHKPQYEHPGADAEMGVEDIGGRQVIERIRFDQAKKLAPCYEKHEQGSHALRQAKQSLNAYPEHAQSLEPDCRNSLKQREHENLVESAVEKLETRDGNASTNARLEKLFGNDSNKYHKPQYEDPGADAEMVVKDRGGRQVIERIRFDQAKKLAPCYEKHEEGSHALRQAKQALNAYPEHAQSLEPDCQNSLKQREHENLVESAVKKIETRRGNATTNARSEKFSGNDSNIYLKPQYVHPGAEAEMVVEDRGDRQFIEQARNNHAKKVASCYDREFEDSKPAKSLEAECRNTVTENDVLDKIVGHLLLWQKLRKREDLVASESREYQGITANADTRATPEAFSGNNPTNIFTAEEELRGTETELMVDTRKSRQSIEVVKLDQAKKLAPCYEKGIENATESFDHTMEFAYRYSSASKQRRCYDRQLRKEFALRYCEKRDCKEPNGRKHCTSNTMSSTRSVGSASDSDGSWHTCRTFHDDVPCVSKTPSRQPQERPRRLPEFKTCPCMLQTYFKMVACSDQYALSRRPT